MLAAVHHAEVVAHRVGEPFGSLVLAVAVTVIEVALIVTLMVSGGSETATLARDTVFAAVMITCNGIVGLSLLVAALRRRVAEFNAEGTATALATVATLATLTLVLPTFTTSRPGPEFSPAQLTFAAVASLALYGLFVFIQTVRHRDYFLPVGATADDPRRARGPAVRTGGAREPRAAGGGAGRRRRAGEDRVARDRGRGRRGRRAAVGGGRGDRAAGAAARDARRRPQRRHDRIQTSFNLALGSAIASIGLTIPAIAVATIWLDGPLVLGLGSTQMVLLAITIVVGALTVLPGRATLQESGVHLVLFAAFLFLAVFP